MSPTETPSTDASQPNTPSFRLWPFFVFLVLQWLAVFGTGAVAPATFVHFFGMMLGPGLGLLLLLGWWLAVCGRPWPQRLFVVLLPIALVVLTYMASDVSVFQAIYIYGVPYLSAAFVLWLVLARTVATSRPLAVWAALAFLVCAGWPLVRSTGVDGNMAHHFAPRWQATTEERFLSSDQAEMPAADTARIAELNFEDEDEDADGADPEATDGAAAEAEDEAPMPGAPGTSQDSQDPAATAALKPAAETPSAEWPGLRGRHRDGVVPGTRLATDWDQTSPEILWRRPVGPGWSSFALVRGVLFTQEQRGDDEVVSAYDAATGEPLWLQSDATRFWEPMAGAGPRATPTYDGGRLYTVGANGIVQALEASDGSQVWQRNLADDTGAPVPDWGFSASPLVSEGLVVVHGGAPDGKAVVAYDRDTGEPVWFGPAGALSYSSLHEVVLKGQTQWLIATGEGVTSFAPDGTLLWDHSWPAPGGARIVQPAFTDDGDVILGTGFGMGLRRIDVVRSGVEGEGDDWSTSAEWTSTAMKPYYNDLVLHEGVAYGFDNRIFAAVDLATGDRIWKGGRFGNGQVLLLPDQDLLLVLSDRGELALVRAVPDEFEQLTSFQAIEGKTWNHPVLVDGVVYVRNAEEMAAVRLPR